MSRLELKNLIKSRKITVEKLAEMVDLNPATIGNYLRGRMFEGERFTVSMSVDNYEKIVKALEGLEQKAEQS